MKRAGLAFLLAAALLISAASAQENGTQTAAAPSAPAVSALAPTAIPLEAERRYVELLEKANAQIVSVQTGWSLLVGALAAVLTVLGIVATVGVVYLERRNQRANRAIADLAAEHTVRLRELAQQYEAHLTTARQDTAALIEATNAEVAAATASIRDRTGTHEANGIVPNPPSTAESLEYLAAHVADRMPVLEANLARLDAMERRLAELNREIDETAGVSALRNRNRHLEGASVPTLLEVARRAVLEAARRSGDLTP